MTLKKDSEPDKSSMYTGSETYNTTHVRHYVFSSILLSLLVITTVVLIIVVPLFRERSSREAVIRIPSEATEQQLRDTLSKYFGPAYADKVLMVAALKGNDLTKRHGAYLIEKDMNSYSAQTRLAKGAQYPVKLVINGFRSPERMAEKIALKMDFSKDSMIKVMNDKETLRSFGISSKDEILAIMPDATYEVYWSNSPAEVLQKGVDNYKLIWTDERKAKAKSLGLTPLETMILCSIVDEETTKADDKGKIGRLYINRLDKGMKLQADPTVRFAIGDFTIKRVKNEHLKFKSPFNTYIVTGLPPAPIRTTSIATIDSVLNSRPNDYIFMCAKDDFSGYHAFATTYEEHQKNARNYQRALNRRGIK